MNKEPKVIFKDLGLNDYKKTWDYQEELLTKANHIKLANRQNHSLSEIKNYFLLVEHPKVITLGRNGNPQNNLLTADLLKKLRFDFYHINRGGDITLHNPGQIIGYPILDLEQFKPDLGWYMRSLEELIILTLLEFDIKAIRIPGQTGVWVNSRKSNTPAKICALGIRTSRWITMHGFALNVNNNLNDFNYIIPCGINDKGVSSMTYELNNDIDINLVKSKILANFVKVFSCKII